MSRDETPDTTGLREDVECAICRRPEHEHRDRNGHGFASHVAAAREADRTPCRCVLHHCCEGCGCGCENESAQSNTFVLPANAATDEVTS